MLIHRSEGQKVQAVYLAHLLLHVYTKELHHLALAVLEHLQGLLHLGFIIAQFAQTVTCHQESQNLLGKRQVTVKITICWTVIKQR